MADLPKSVRINEEGPREGFQIEKGPIPTARKIEFIEALSQTGLKHIQITSFVNPKRVPGMADAEDVVRGFKPKPGVDYTALWLNEKGLERARAAGKLTLEGKISIYASEKFSVKNNNRTTAQEFEYARRVLEQYLAHGIPVERGSVAAAFGCNYQGDIPLQAILDIVRRIFELADEYDVKLKELSFADTMAWATPLQIKRLTGAVREKYPDMRLEPAPSRHARDGYRKRARRPRNGRGHVRCVRGRPRRLSVRRAQGRGRQRLHGRPGLHVPGDGHRDGHRPRQDHRVRAARRRHRRASAAGLGQARREPRQAARRRRARLEETTVKENSIRRAVREGRAALGTGSRSSRREAFHASSNPPGSITA